MWQRNGEGSPESFLISLEWQAQQTHKACPGKADTHCGLFILSQLLAGLPLPWAALLCGGWDSAVHISALLAGALLVSRRDCRTGGRRRDLLLPVSFYEDLSTNTSLQWQSHPVTAAQCSLKIFNPVQPLHFSRLRNTRTRHPHRSVFNSRDTLLWDVKF